MNFQGTAGRSRLDAETVNRGTFNVDVDGVFLGTSLTNEGEINIADGASFNVGNSLVNDGTVSGGGTLQLGNLTTFFGGELEPGSEIGALTIAGDIEFAADALLNIELGGTQQILEYDLLAINGDLELDGLLQVSLVDDFADSILSSDTFTILTVSNSLIGTFDGVLDNEQLITSDGTGAFTVNYSGSDVILSNYITIAVPEPSGTVLLAMVFGLGAFRRKRSL